MLNALKVCSGKGIKSSIIIDSNVIIDTFDSSSPNYKDSYNFMEHVISKKILFAMPMHGWFEINCTLNRKKKEGLITALPVFAGRMEMPIEFIHIDDKFLENYIEVEVPLLKGMDHIFLVVAKKNNLSLITWDNQMITAGKACGVNIFTPVEWMQDIAACK